MLRGRSCNFVLPRAQLYGSNIKARNDPVESDGSVKLADVGIGASMYMIPSGCDQFILLLWRHSRDPMRMCSVDGGAMAMAGPTN